MNKLRKYGLLIAGLVGVLLLILLICDNKKENLPIDKNATSETVEEPHESCNLFGTWRIDKAVLWSEMYTGTIKDGVDEEDLFDPESFIGYELEYSGELFRLGDKEYENPKYIETYVTLEEFNHGGRFQTPEVYDIIENLNIQVGNEETNLMKTKVPQYEISFEQETKYNDFSFIPIGTELVLLNEDVMLVGLWGEILIAYRVGNSEEDAYALLNNTEMQMLVETSFDEQEIANNKQLHYNTFETAQTAYSGELFPQELILECQDVLHKTFESGKDVTDANGEYLQWLESLGGMDYMLTLEEIYELFPMTKEKDFVDIYDAYAFISDEEYCTGIFGYKNADGQNEYVLCVDSNGSYGNYNIYIAEYAGNEFVIKNSFEAQSEGLGRVISYEDNFYYVLLQYNDNLKNFDGVKIHKLDEKAETNNVRIRYIPDEYAWETVHVNSDFPKREYRDIDLYIQSIQQEIGEGNYLEKGKPDGEWDCFMGDEVQDDSFPLTTEFEQYVKADLANVGMDVFLQKKIFLPSSSSYTAYFKTDFYLHDCENNEIMQLDKIKINNNASNQLIQMWFKRIGNKIYTFKIHHLKDYDYLLEVVLVEGSQITRIRQDLITAIRHFELLEGHELNTGI